MPLGLLWSRSVETAAFQWMRRGMATGSIISLATQRRRATTEPGNLSMRLPATSLPGPASRLQNRG